MGCATSKPKVCENCKAPLSRAPRSYSAHVHHKPQGPGDGHHMVALTSSTLGSLRLDRSHTTYHIKKDLLVPAEDGVNEPEKINISKEDMEICRLEAKTWSRMIEEKIPKVAPQTPVRTPPGEPEMINAWELMEGLEDTSPISTTSPNRLRSFSFPVAADENGDRTPQPMWVENADRNGSHLHPDAAAALSEFDAQVISTFRKALEELPPANPFHLKPLKSEEKQALEKSDMKKVNGFVSREKLVLYFTSLRGVRKTYEDCCHVRVILKGLGIKVDERDVSMHSGFKEELKELLGDGYSGGGLPKVFLGTKLIGGAEEIRRMNDSGQLEKVVAGCERVDDGGGGGGGNAICEACGDIRFVPCLTCSGSCKIYYEGDYGDDQDEHNEEDEYGFQRCPDCNENGLIRCPLCCD